MWSFKYRNYPKDKPIKQERRDRIHGGCEMQERYGWGVHHKKTSERGFLRDLLSIFFKKG